MGFWSLSAGNHALPQTARKRQRSESWHSHAQQVRAADVNLGVLALTVVGSTSDGEKKEDSPPGRSSDLEDTEDTEEKQKMILLFLPLCPPCPLW
jgi:hypothetical protein